eukprot:scaffold8138_cov277-Pinguiococcus_pyrenoidosus.AAC.3
MVPGGTGKIPAFPLRFGPLLLPRLWSRASTDVGCPPLSSKERWEKSENDAYASMENERAQRESQQKFGTF